MNRPSIETRVEILEMQMEPLGQLPGRVAALENRVGSLELQVVQLRDDMHGEFSSLRAEVRAGDEETRSLRGEMRTLEAGLRQEMRSLNHETATQMRVLHEDVIARIALLDEHTNGPTRRRYSGRKRDPR